jgi:hypothetical protein
MDLHGTPGRLLLYWTMSTTVVDNHARNAEEQQKEESGDAIDGFTEIASARVGYRKRWSKRSRSMLGLIGL